LATTWNRFERCVQVQVQFIRRTEFTLVPLTLVPKEPDMTQSRLALLIDSLASGSEVFSSHVGEDGGLNEMDVVLNSDGDI